MATPQPRQISKRVLQVKLIDANGTEYLVNTGGLAEIQFSYTHTIGGLGRASIKIYNLNPNIVSQFTTQDYYPQKKKIVEVYVGREGDETKLTYTGEILFAQLTQGRPDSIFSIEAMEVYSGLNKEIDTRNIDFGDTPTCLSVVHSILKSIRLEVGGKEIQGFTVNDKAIQDGLNNTETAGVFTKYEAPVEEGYFYSGKVSEFLQSELKNFSGMQFLQDGTTITLLPNSLDQQLLLKNTSNLITSLKDKGEVISADATGNLAQMIGLPSPSYYGVSLRTLYPQDRSRIKAGDIFLLQSRVFANNPNKSLLDGVYNIPYQITSIRYSLQLRGQNWYQDIEAIRYINNSSKDENTTSLSSATKENVATAPAETPAKVAKVAAKVAVDGMQCRAPVKVVKVDRNNLTVDVDILLKKVISTIKEGERDTIEYQTIKAIPIRVPQAGGLAVIMPVQVGDVGWLVASDMDTPAWREAWANGDSNPVRPRDWRTHQYAWGYFEPETILPSKALFVMENADNALVLQTLEGDHGIALFPDGTITINAKSLTINGDTTINGTLTNNGINMTRHVHTQSDPTQDVSEPHN